MNSGSAMDLLITADRVLTLDANDTVAKAVHVRDGRVHAIGEPAQLEKALWPDSSRIDLPGRTIIPGFIDGHNHFSFGAFEAVQVDCSTPPIASLATVLLRLEERAARAEPGQWVRGWGFHWSRVTESRNPTRAELDRVAPDNPLILMDASYHGCFVNSLALQRAGIDVHSGAGRSGIMVYDEHGDLTGALLETASDLPQTLSWESVPDASVHEAIRLIAANGKRHLAAGITSVSDALVTTRAHTLYREAAKTGQLPLSVHEMRGGRTFFEPPRVDSLDGDYLASHGNRLRGGTIKLFMDVVHPGPAVDRRSDDGHDVHTGVMYYSKGEVTRLVGEILARGLEPAVHALGNCAVEQILDVFEEARSTKAGSHASLRIEHFILASRQQAVRAAELGAKVTVNPAFLHQWGDMYLHTWRGDGQPHLKIIPIRSLLDAGATVAGASDYPCAPFAPLVGIEAAVTRGAMNGEIVDADEGITPLEALRMFTSSAAVVSGTASTEGTLEPGKRANLTVLDANLLDASPSTIHSIRVVRTYIDGELAFEADGEP
jgi:predicted amidohydrolase YtcJ